MLVGVGGGVPRCCCGGLVDEWLFWICGDLFGVWYVFDVFYLGCIGVVVGVVF